MLLSWEGNHEPVVQQSTAEYITKLPACCMPSNQGSAPVPHMLDLQAWDIPTFKKVNMSPQALY